MNKTYRLKALLELGYFPEELPPPFNTRDFAKHRGKIFKTWNGIGPQYPKSSYEVYTVPRIKRTRRTLALPNPITQMYLSNLIADKWVAIRKHLGKSKYAIQSVEIENGPERAIAPPDFPLFNLRRAEISASYSHALASDISRFYGTLYTHVIPWALHTKSWCKQHLNTNAYKATLGAQLDKAVRKGQDDQTIGIPVGPDTSRILSEIVAVAIDIEVEKTLNLDNKKAVRLIDDFYLGFDTVGEAENAIAKLSIASRTYELELNDEKTRVLDPALSVDNIWPTELREFQFKTFTPAQGKSIEHYFTKAFDFSAKFPDQNVLDFAIKRTKSLSVKKENWRGYETFLLKAARSNSTVIPTVVQILTSYNSENYPLDSERIKKLSEDLIRLNSPPGHHAEVAWALFLAKALKFQLSSSAAKHVASLENSVCALIALDLDKNGLFAKPIDKALWLQSMNTQGLRSSMWLLAYEADLKGWLTGTPPDFVQVDAYFGTMKSKKVSFYDTKKNVLHIKKEKPKAPTAGFLKFLHEFDADEIDLGPTSFSSTYYI